MADITVTAPHTPDFYAGMHVVFQRSEWWWPRMVRTLRLMLADGVILELLAIASATRAWQRARRWAHRQIERLHPQETYRVVSATESTLTVDASFSPPAIGDTFYLSPP